MKYKAESFTSTNFENKLNKLFNVRYGEERGLKKHRFRSTFVDDYSEKFNIDIDGVQKHWFAHTRKPTVQQLMNICELLDCDIDYFLTDQEEFKKEIASAAEVTGLPYEAIERISRYGKKKHYSEIVDFQFLKLLLSSDEIFENVVSCLSTLVFTMEGDECFEIQSAYDLAIDDDEHRKNFVNEIDLEPYCFNYSGRIYAPDYSGTFGFGAVSFELIQELTKLKENEKKYREANKKNVKVLVDWEVPEDDNKTEKEEEESYKKYCDYIENVKSQNMNIELKRVYDWKKEEI